MPASVRALLARTGLTRERRRIPRDEVRFLGFATLDPMGRPFSWRGEIYRAIYPESVELVHQLFRCGLMRALVESGRFIETELTDLSLDGFPLVLRHKRITASLPTEWTASMLRDAALTILEVNRICNQHGFELRDAHPYNVSFDGSAAKWIDPGSIGPLREGWIAGTEFVDYSLVPMVYLLRGELLEGYSILMSERSLRIGTKPFRESLLFERFLGMIGETRESLAQVRFDAEWIARQVASGPAEASMWAAYQHGEKSPLDDLRPHPENRFQRFFRIAELVGVHARDARTAVDLAGNVGLASLILSEAHPHLRCVNTDYEPAAIEKSFALLKAHPRFRVESYLLNFMLPMYADSVERFRADLVLALAVTHHLLLTQGHKLDEVFEKIAAFSRKYVFIEFMPLGMWGGDPLTKPPVPEGYTVEWFQRGFERHFRLLERSVIESHTIAGVLEPHRVLFVGRLR